MPQGNQNESQARVSILSESSGTSQRAECSTGQKPVWFCHVCDKLLKTEPVLENDDYKCTICGKVGFIEKQPLTVSSERENLRQQQQRQQQQRQLGQLHNGIQMQSVAGTSSSAATQQQTNLNFQQSTSNNSSSSNSSAVPLPPPEQETFTENGMVLCMDPATIHHRRLPRWRRFGGTGTFSDIVNLARQPIAETNNSLPLMFFLRSLAQHPSAVLREIHIFAFESSLPRRIPTCVASLPEVTVTELGGDCPICQDTFSVGEKVKRLTTDDLQCSHRFHERCIKPWLERTNTCPMCRFELPVEYAESTT